jgi:hypothetical protein
MVLPSKRLEQYIWLSRELPEQRFNLLSISQQTEALRLINQASQGRVNFLPLVRFHELPALYKQHGWLVYTACSVINTAGWPMALAEAQAAGLGICMARIRPDIRDYVGDSAYLFDDISEVCDIIRKPLDRDRRDAGFENALRMDIGLHISKLTELWDTAPQKAVMQHSIMLPQRQATTK